MTVQTEILNVEALDAEIKAFDPDLAELSMLMDDANPEIVDALNQLNQEVVEAGFTNGLQTMSFSTLAESEDEVIFVNNYIKGRAERLIRLLNGYARRYGRCVTCVRTLAGAVAAYRRGQFYSALTQASRAYTCFRGCRR